MIGGFPASSLDVETYPNFFLIGTLDIATGEVQQWSTEPGIGGTLVDFRAWFTAHKQERLFVNFNGCFYDNAMVKAVLEGCDAPAELYKRSVEIIPNG